MLKRVYVEITNVCNLSCTFCPGTRRSPAFMAPADFALVLRRLRGVTEHIYLHVMGEPLLHPELPTLLALAGEAGYKVYVTTNGTLLGERGALLLAAPAVKKVSDIYAQFRKKQDADYISEFDRVMERYLKGGGNP